MKQRLVLYHGGCQDGFAAAWAAWMCFGDDGTEYRPALYGQPPPDVEGRDLLIVDFSYQRDTLLAMASIAKSIRVLDHHATAEADLKGLDFCVFDMSRSGAGITWDELHEQPRSWIVDYVEDRDLWRWKLPRSKEVNALLSTLPHEFREFQAAHYGMSSTNAAFKGEAVLAHIDRYVDAVSAEARIAEFHGMRVPVVNAPYVMISEVLQRLAAEHGVAVGWFCRHDGKVQFSLRSRGDSAIDVSQLAREYGGGGHFHAAGFQLDKPIEWSWVL